MRKTIVFTILILFISPFASLGQTEPAAKYTLSASRVAQLKEQTYFYVSESTTYSDLGEALQKMFGEVRQAMKRGGISATGAPIAIYHASSPDPEKVFILDVGFPVADDTVASGQAHVRRLTAVQSVTALYTGSMIDSSIGQAYGKLYSQMTEDGHLPSDEYREHYLYWEDADSTNNVVMFEIPLRN